MNLDLDLLPERCDAIVVGAGPAGAAAAQWLARAGRSVVLVDAQAFPRDKVCGDGLIPDAHRALDRLGVLAQVMAEARSSTTLACIAPRGGRIDVPGRLAVLPRKRLDEIICQAAVAAGGAGADDDRVGALGQELEIEVHDVRAGCAAACRVGVIRQAARIAAAVIVPTSANVSW